MRRVLSALVLVVVLLTVAASPAAAHTELVSTEPTDGAVLQSSPEAVVLRFTEPVEVQPGAVAVFDADARRIDTGGVVRDGVLVRLPVALDPGGYAVTYRVVSLDGHPIGGSFTFRITQQAEEVAPEVVEELRSSQRADPSVGAAAGVFRFIAFLSLVVLVGGSLLVSWLWPEGHRVSRVRRTLVGSLIALAVSTTALVALHAADVAGLGAADALRPAVVSQVLDGRVALLSMARVLLLVPASFLLVALFRGAGRRLWWRAAAVALAVAIVAVTALNAHAAGGRWQEAALVADVIHLLAGAAWLGGLALVVAAVLPRGADADVPVVVGRFSRLALWSVAVVVLTGTFQSLRQVGGSDGLDTPYGRLLLAKVVAVAGLVALAALARQLVRHRLDDEAAVSEVRRIVGIESVVAVVVLAVTALLVDATPPRTGTFEAVSRSRVVDGDPTFEVPIR